MPLLKEPPWSVPLTISATDSHLINMNGLLFNAINEFSTLMCVLPGTCVVKWGVFSIKLSSQC